MRIYVWHIHIGHASHGYENKNDSLHEKLGVASRYVIG